MTSKRRQLASWAGRTCGYLALWVLLIGPGLGDLLVGLVAAVFAARVSVWLLPPGELPFHPRDLPRYVAHFLRESMVAGIDVTRRAFAPRIDLRPGIVKYACSYPRGAQRNIYAAVTSLLPGTLALLDERHVLHIHCLDTRQPVLEQLAQEEAALVRTLSKEEGA